MEARTSPQVRVDTHVPRCPAQTLSFPVWDVLFRLGVPVLLGHAKVDDVDDVGRLGLRAADEEVVGLDVAVDEVLFMYRLDARELYGDKVRLAPVLVAQRRTICLAVMQTDLMLNLRPHMSNRSSSEGPSRSMTRMLCRPSCPK